MMKNHDKLYQLLTVTIILSFALISLATPRIAKAYKAVTANISHSATSGDWGSWLIKFGSKGGGRALVPSQSVKNNYLLFIDYRFSDCNKASIGLINVKKRVSKRAIKGIATIHTRVDRSKIHHYLTFYYGDSDDKRIFWYLRLGNNKRKKFIRNINSGKILRLKLPKKDTKKVHYLSFSLKGSGDSIKRAHKLCIAHQPASNFFPHHNKKQKNSSEKKLLKHPLTPLPKKASSHKLDEKTGSSQNNKSTHNAGNAESSANSLKDYTFALSQAIAAKKRYPLAARRQNLQGHVEVRVVIQQSGKISHLSITKSSGHKILDHAAIKAVKDAAPYGAFPTNVHKSQLAIIVPFDFGLTK